MTDGLETKQREQHARHIAMNGADISGPIERHRAGKNSFVIDDFGEDGEVLQVVKTNLPTAREQPAMTREEYKRRQNDIDAHTNSQLYSCGSLAPKLGKGRKDGAGRIGCCNGALTSPFGKVYTV